MSDKDLDDLLAAEAAHVEALEGEGHPEVSADIRGEGRVSRSRVLQVRLNPDELEALERIAERRQLPVSTVAREALLAMVHDDAADTDVVAELSVAADRIKTLVGMMAPLSPRS